MADLTKKQLKLVTEEVKKKLKSQNTTIVFEKNGVVSCEPQDEKKLLNIWFKTEIELFGIKNQEDFLTLLDLEFTISEIKKMQTIYYGNEHIEYYVAYNCGEYKKCYDYLLKNRHLLK